MPSAAGTLSPEAVPLADFEKLTRIPIVIYYGDNFPAEPTTERGQDNWRVRLAMARLWVDAINKHGGDARLVHLPEIGIRGNTHFLMSDLNNVADRGSGVAVPCREESGLTVAHPHMTESHMRSKSSTRAGASSSEPRRSFSQVQS